MAFTVLYLAAIVLVPLLTLPLKSFSEGWDFFWNTVRDPRVVASYRLTIGASFVAASVNGVLRDCRRVGAGALRLPGPPRGRRDDRPAVRAPDRGRRHHADQPLCAQRLVRPVPRRRTAFKAVFSPLGITIALIFIGLPFVVRTLQPVIADLDVELEEVAASLGANRVQVVFRVILPYLYPAWLIGFGLAFARAIGEYGSVVFIAGNMPMKTEIASLLIITKLTQYDYAGAAAIAFVLLLLSFVLLLVLNALQGWSAKRLGY